MTQDEALHALADADVVPCMEAGLVEAKELLSACLDAGIPALLDRADCCGKGGCGCAPKLALLVKPDDVPQVAAVFRQRWSGMLEREGTLEADGTATAETDEPPCPACGTAAPLVDGACGECGLQLG